MANALVDTSTHGKRYELCGPSVYTLRHLVEYTASVTGYKRAVVGLGQGLSRLQARVAQCIPGKPFSVDNYDSLQVDSVCSQCGLSELGVTLTALETIAPSYLGTARRQNRYDQYRTGAHRD